MLGLPEDTPMVPDPPYDYVENPRIDEIYDKFNEGPDHNHDD